ncbi:hypothetical protein [Sciscionella marina]|uniref:hypothetical protein n=1 Tax=Sciscionella marina TaxID=508770 RepID=UPI00035ED0E9|nr:hypothetical protein [Sciscionella marina]
MHRHDAVAQGEQPDAGAEHRDTILLLIQALNARISGLDNDPAPPGWWFTPPAHYFQQGTE